MFETLKGAPPEPSIHVPKSFVVYKPELSVVLKKKFPEIRLDITGFDNLMKLILSGKSPHAVMMWLLNGDNYEAALADLDNVHAFTQENKYIGPNVELLGALIPFMDLRQDQPSLKPVPGKPGEYAIVSAQASFTKAILAPRMASLGIDYFATFDPHSYLAGTHFKEAGVEPINLTAAILMIKELKNRSLLNGNLENVICGVDLGNLPLAKTVKDYLEINIAMIDKIRIPDGDTGDSKVENNFIYGNVRGKRVIVMDDMISSGTTLIETVKELLNQGAKEILVCATHPVFVKDYYNKLQELLQFEEVKIVLTTNTLPLERPHPYPNKTLPKNDLAKPSDPPERKQVQMLDIDADISEVLESMLKGGSAPEVRELLSGLAIVRESPRQIYRDLTGKNLPERKVTHEYVEGKFIPLKNA